jgi:polar amino acid transport system substrate-binding protein
MKVRSLLLMIYIVAMFPKFLWADDIISHCRDYPPELYFDGEKCVGAVPDLVNDIVTELGHNIIWVKAPWSRSIKDAKEGRVDLLIRHSMTPERALYLQPIQYAHRIRKLIFYKSATLKSDIKSYKDLQQVIVGAIRGVYYSPSFSNLDKSRVILVGETEQLVSMLALGRIDVAVTSASHRIELFADQFEETTFSDSFYNPIFISIAKTSQITRHYEDIANLMMKYRKSGKINQYFEKYDLHFPEQIFEQHSFSHPITINNL